MKLKKNFIRNASQIKNGEKFLLYILICFHLNYCDGPNVISVDDAFVKLQKLCILKNSLEFGDSSQAINCMLAVGSALPRKEYGEEVYIATESLDFCIASVQNIHSANSNDFKLLFVFTLQSVCDLSEDKMFNQRHPFEGNFQF